MNDARGIMHGLDAVGTLVVVRIPVGPDGQMPVVGHGEGVLVERLEPGLLLLCPAGIEEAAQLAAPHLEGVGADGIGGNACAPAGEEVGVGENGATIVATDDVAAIRPDVHRARHEAIRNVSDAGSPSHEASAAVYVVAADAAGKDAVLHQRELRPFVEESGQPAMCAVAIDGGHDVDVALAANQFASGKVGSKAGELAGSGNRAAQG